jgi:hypothetical protein
MRVRFAGAAHAAGTRLAGTRRRGGFIGNAGGEYRQFFGELFGTALRAGGSFPFAGADEKFAVSTTFSAMKLVDGHTFLLRSF